LIELILTVQTDNLVRKEPLSQREILVAVENLYDLVLNMETLKRNEPTPEDTEEYQTGWFVSEILTRVYDLIYSCLGKFNTTKPLRSYGNHYGSWYPLRLGMLLFIKTSPNKANSPPLFSNPHPFISLLIPSKGKKILPRVTRHLSHARMFTLLTLLVACFDQLDVVRQAHVLDTVVESTERADVERQTEAFLMGVLHSILPVVARADLRLVTGLLGLLLDRTNIVQVAKSGVRLFLLFFRIVDC
jgi:DNA topoisomerase 2-associated protein PAT1